MRENHKLMNEETITMNKHTKNANRIVCVARMLATTKVLRADYNGVQQNTSCKRSENSNAVRISRAP
jgi:hypothetical protein